MRWTSHFAVILACLATASGARAQYPANPAGYPWMGQPGMPAAYPWPNPYGARHAAPMWPGAWPQVQPGMAGSPMPGYAMPMPAASPPGGMTGAQPGRASTWDGPVNQAVRQMPPPSAPAPQAMPEAQAEQLPEPSQAGSSPPSPAPVQAPCPVVVMQPIWAVPPPPPCQPPAAPCCEWCPPYRCAWINAEYLLWWMRGPKLPPLATESPEGTPLDEAGVLGTPGVVVLFGDERVNENSRSGFRISAGAWLDDCQCWGLDAEYLWLGNRGTNFTAGSDGDRIISRPFFNAATGQEDAELVSFPGVLAGSVTVNARTSGLEGIGGHFRRNCCCNCCSRLDVLLGYRYLRFTDELFIREDLIGLPGGTAPAGTQFIVQDRFATENEFNGLDLGLAAEFRYQRWYLGLLGRVALGVNSRVVDISGATTFIVPDSPTETQQGGLLAQSSNIGTYRDNDWSFVPEVRINLGCQVLPCLRTYVGYTFLAMTGAAYAGEQIDLAVNPALLPAYQTPPTPPIRGERPAFFGNQSIFWAQGLQFGIEFGF